MQITVDLTDNQVEFLKRSAANHYPGSDQNLATSSPIHLVQTRRETEEVHTVEVDRNDASCPDCGHRLTTGIDRYSTPWLESGRIIDVECEDFVAFCKHCGWDLTKL